MLLFLNVDLPPPTYHFLMVLFKNTIDLSEVVSEYVAEYFEEDVEFSKNIDFKVFLILWFRSPKNLRNLTLSTL